LKEGRRGFDGDFDRLPLTLLLAVSPPEQLSAPRTLEKLSKRKAKENMEQCKSKDRDFKSYANAVFGSGCCCLSASLST
jgi:hypothetical protein